MNSAKLRDTRLIHRKLLLFYTLIINYQKVKTSLFKMPSERLKCLGINLTKEVKDVYSENNKALMKKVEDDAKK